MVRFRTWDCISLDFKIIVREMLKMDLIFLGLLGSKP